MPLNFNGDEKRYINGREIVIKPKQPTEIQKKIDTKTLDLPGDMKDLRSLYDPDSLYKDHISNLADSFGRDSFMSYSKFNHMDKERDKNRGYQIFREMYTQTFIKNALDIIKNETAQKNDEGNLIKVVSENQDIIDESYELFYDILDLNFELKSMILETCQMGDNYYEVILDDYKNPKSVIHLEYLRPERITAVQHNGRLKFYIFTEDDINLLRNNTYLDPWNFINNNENIKKVKIFMPWQIIHFKIKDRFSEPYGRSLLRSGIKDYRRLALLEDAMLVYRISRAPERRVFYVDVGQLNSVDAKIFLNKIKNNFKKEPIIDESGNLSERANVMCISLDTKIPLLDGRTLTLQEMIKEYSSGKTNWVYSIDRDNNNKIVAGKVINAACTRLNAEVMEVVLDNGEKITCTPDHKFIMRDGSKREAKDLKKDDALMPLYRKISERNDKDRIFGYEKVYNPSDESYVFTHRMVGNNVLSEEREKIRKNTDWSKNNNLTIHHKDFNKKNNSPENLKWIGNTDHILEHANLNPFEHLREYIESDRHKENTKINNLKRNSVKAMEWYNGSDLHKEHNKIRSANLKKQFSDPELRKKYISGMTICDKFTDKFWNIIEEIAKQTKLNKQNYVSIKNIIENIITSKEAMNEWNNNISIKSTQKNTFNKKILERALRSKGINSNQEWLENLGLSTKDNRKIYKNHKVAYTRFLSERMDTGCITVDKYHNFATESVVINNSLMEDFYIPVREGTQGTKIDTLQPGQQLNEIRDVDYFKDKLLRLLNIPMPYLGGSPEQGVAEATKSLSNIDIKFSNYIEEIQSYITKGLNKLLALQLILKNYRNEDIINFKVELTPPSNLNELIKLDALTQRANVAGTYKGLQMFSDEWIYRKIFKLSKKEIYQEQVKIAQQMQKLGGQIQQPGMGGEIGGVVPPMGGEIGGATGTPGTTPQIGGEVQPPPPPIGQQGQQLANFNPMIYQLGLSVLNDNYEQIIINKLSQKFGNGYLMENKNEIINFVNEIKTLRSILDNDDESLKEKENKKRHKNNFQSMVRLGEFSGIDLKTRCITYYREGLENTIFINSQEEEFKD